MAVVNSCTKEFDIIIFGATGFTGKNMVKEMLVACGAKRPWAIAGRTKTKLDQLKQELMLPESVGLVEANVDNEQSIRDMCTRSRSLINCVGPYGVYRGALVIRMCVEEECDYLDITGEIEFIAEMRDRYGREAEEKGVFVVPSCGYIAAVPELAANCTLEKHPSLQLSSVSLLGMINDGSTVHTGTWHSILESLSNWRKTVKSLKKIESLQYSPVRSSMCPMYYSSQWRRWFTNSSSWNSYVLRISQSDRAKRDEKNEPSLVINEFTSLGGFLRSALMIISILLVFIPAQFSFSRRILLKFPELFSFGLFSNAGPSEATLRNSTFHNVFEARLSGPAGESGVATVNVRGAEPGYIATSCLCVNSALTLVEERGSIVSTTRRNGGVLTPGFAFENTSLVERLNASQKLTFLTN